MPKKGQTLPYKVVYSYPDCPPVTAAKADEPGAHRLAGDIGTRGGGARVVLRVPDEEDQILGTYGPGVDHDIAEDLDTGAWACSCGARADSYRDAYGAETLTDHLYHLGRQAVAWMVFNSPAPEVSAVEPGPASIDIPGYVLDWAARHGVDVDNPDAYILVTTMAEAAEIDGTAEALVARRNGAVPDGDFDRIEKALADRDMESLPEQMRR